MSVSSTLLTIAGVSRQTFYGWEQRRDQLIPDGYAAQRLESFFTEIEAVTARALAEAEAA